MSNEGEASTLNTNLRPVRHVSKHSVDTNASGIAESAISFSQFPPPPLEIPTTPIRNGFSTTPSPVRPGFSPVHPLRPRKGSTNKPQPFPDEASSSRSFQSVTGSAVSQAAQVPPTAAQRISPHDWHDGSSSIDIDPTESRLLPTSLITSLLEENKNLRRAVRSSYTSDAFSGISEMTYPPPAPFPEPSSARRGNPYRVQGPRNAPPSAFSHIPVNAAHRVSSDSATLHGQQGVVKRVNEMNPASSQGPVVVGIATATLRNVAGSSRPPSSQTVPMSVDEEKEVKYGFAAYDMDDDSILRYKVHGQHSSPPSHQLQHPPPNLARRRPPRHHPQPSTQARQSTYSLKSLAPSFVSRISLPASVRRMLRLRKKPLPPVPRIPDIPVAVERETRRAEEVAPLPDLAGRADTLHALLEKGYHPHHSVGTYHEVPDFPATPGDPSSPYQDHVMGATGTYRPIRPLYYSDFNHPSDDKAPTLSFNAHGPSPRSPCLPRFSKRTRVAIAIVIAAIIAAIVASAVVVSKRKQSGPKCLGSLVGASCNLNSTCVCTSESRCNPLAQNILDLIPSVNEAFNSNFASNDVYNSLWYMQGSPSRNDCSPQSLLVDVGEGLKQESYPNRTRWVQAALLWNAIQSQDLEESEKLREFVQNAPWRDLPDDGPTNTKETSFSGNFSGHIFNFVAQTVSYPPASFIDNGQPTREQIGRLGSTVAQSALDRTYMFALALSTQQSMALKNYWTTTLSQKSDDLRAFKALLSISPILLPFNATSPSIRTLLSNSSTTSFPPPLACYPRLASQRLDQINSFETSVFQLPEAPSTSNFTQGCFPDRPVYGVLDILRLRLPFLDDSRPRQAVVLRAEAVPRAAVYIGNVLGAAFSSTNTTQAPSNPQDSRRVGTLSYPDHVLLQYLTSMPVETAVELIKFVLASGSRIPVPPDPSSPLFTSLRSLPVLEVAVFGDILSSDVSGTVSSLNVSSRAMFFGSADGETFRRWSIASRGGVTWAQNATSPLIVKDPSFDDTMLNAAWEATSNAIRQNLTEVERQLIDSFASTGKLTTG